jgi:hypothetical protein
VLEFILDRATDLPEMLLEAVPGIQAPTRKIFSELFPQASADGYPVAWFFSTSRMAAAAATISGTHPHGRILAQKRRAVLSCSSFTSTPTPSCASA